MLEAGQQRSATYKDRCAWSLGMGVWSLLLGVPRGGPLFFPCPNVSESY
jgi:hypothetical protein